MYHNFLIHLSVSGHLGCFHVLAIVNSAPMNIGVHVSLSILVSLVCMPSSGIIGSLSWKNLPAMLGDLGLIPGLGSSPGEGKGYPLQYLGLENSMDCIVSVQFSHCHVWLFATPWAEACKASQSFTVSRSLLKLMSIESMMPSNHLILCRPLLLLPSIFLSLDQGIFKWVSSLHQVAKVLELQLQYQSFQ